MTKGVQKRDLCPIYERLVVKFTRGDLPEGNQLTRRRYILYLQKIVENENLFLQGGTFLSPFIDHLSSGEGYSHFSVKKGKGHFSTPFRGIPYSISISADFPRGFPLQCIPGNVQGVEIIIYAGQGKLLEISLRSSFELRLKNIFFSGSKDFMISSVTLKIFNLP